MEIQVHLMREAEDFLHTLDKKTQKKIHQNILRTKLGERGDWFEKMAGTYDLWEFRTFYNRQYVRLFAFWDKRMHQKPGLIVCTHGFLKTTGKTPQRELERALALKAWYFSHEI